MLTLAQKGQLLLYMAPFFAFWFGIMWQSATHELKQERKEQMK